MAFCSFCTLPWSSGRVHDACAVVSSATHMWSKICFINCQSPVCASMLLWQPKEVVYIIRIRFLRRWLNSCLQVVQTAIGMWTNSAIWLTNLVSAANENIWLATLPAHSWGVPWPAIHGHIPTKAHNITLKDLALFMTHTLVPCAYCIMKYQGWKNVRALKLHIVYKRLLHLLCIVEPQAVVLVHDTKQCYTAQTGSKLML